MVDRITSQDQLYAVLIRKGSRWEVVELTEEHSDAIERAERFDQVNQRKASRVVPVRLRKGVRHEPSPRTRIPADAR